MTAEEFRQRVIAHPARAGVSEDALTWAIQHCLREGHTGESAIQVCLDYARDLDKFSVDKLSRKQRAAEAAEPLESSPSPWAVMNRDLTIQRIGPRVRQVRREMFEREDPPFRRYDAAVRWLVKTGDEQWIKGEERLRQIAPVDEICRIATQFGGHIVISRRDESLEKIRKEVNDRAEGLWHVSLTRRELPYKTSNQDCIPARNKDAWDYTRQTFPGGVAKLWPPGTDMVWSIPIYPDSPLAPLEKAARDIAEGTGFSKPDAVAYILASVKPLFEPIKLDVIKPVEQGLAPGIPARPKVDIHLFDPEHFSIDQAKALQRQVRSACNATKRKVLTARDLRFLEICNRELTRFMQPETWNAPIRVFWERVQQAWNREIDRKRYKTKKYTHWRSPEMKYKRLTKKLDREGVFL